MLKKKKEIPSFPPYEERSDLKKLSLYVTIVNHGQSGPIMKIFQNAGANAQFIQLGHGTAGRQVLDILGISDNRKEIVLSIIKQEALSEVKKELEAFFMINKRNKGVGFSIAMTSIIGVKVYQFLANA